MGEKLRLDQYFGKTNQTDLPNSCAEDHLIGLKLRSIPHFSHNSQFKNRIRLL